MSVWDMTAPVRACVARGAFDRQAGLDCLHDLGLTPPCASIWMDNGDYTRANCLLPCLVHFGSPYNEPEGCWRDPSNGRFICTGTYRCISLSLPLASSLLLPCFSQQLRLSPSVSASQD